MGILDKLRPQPRWKHADPAVRLEAIPTIDEPQAFVELATTDPDARVRLKALDHVEDVDVLAAVAARDADTGVRDAAADALLEIALNPAAEAAIVQKAAAGIADERRLSSLARTSPHAAAREAAVARVADAKLLGAIARTAQDEVVAHAAAGRLSDTHALLDVALNSTHKDVAMSAFERIIDEQAGPSDLDNTERLEQLAARSQQKAVARRAKALLQAMADAEAARKAAEEEHRRQIEAIVDTVERLAAEEDWRAADAALGRARDAWAAAGEVTDAAMTSRFDSASAAVRARIDAAREAEAAAAARAEERARALAAREAVCARIERLDARAEVIQTARAEWEGMPPVPDGGPDEAALRRRFERALELCERRHEQREQAEASLQTLRDIAAEAASLSGNTLDEAVTRWKALRKRWKDTEQTLTNLAMDPPADAAETMRAAEAAITGRENEAREQKLKAAAEYVARIDRLSDRAERIANAEAITLREGERLMRDARTALDLHVEVKPEGYDAAVAKLRGLLEKVGPKVRELRELDDWRRFANAQAQEELIHKAEALAAELEADAAAGRESDLGKAAATLRELQAKWKTAAEAPRDRAQELWHRFRTPVDAVRARCATYFERQAVQRSENLRRKQELCERAEALAGSTDWVKTAEAFRQLQADWQAAGPIPPREARQLWDRFRKASDQFFTRRRDDLASRKSVWAENLAKKEALCDRAEALAESSDWDAAASELKRLQAEWKTIGPVRKSRSEVVWKRFRAAADRFFERYHNRHQVALEQKAADREALVAELEAIAATEDAQPENLAARVQDIRAKLRVPPPLNRAEIDAQNARAAAALPKIVERWPAAFQGTDLDPEAAIKRMEKLCVKAEALAETAEPAEERARPMSQAEALAAKLRQALAANTFGGRAADDRGPSVNDQVRDLQSAWQRLLIPHTEPAREMEERFKRAIAAARDKARGKKELTRA